MSYDPSTLGAKCSACPFFCKEDFRPMAPVIKQGASFILVPEAPRHGDLDHSKLLSDKVGSELQRELKAVDLPLTSATIVPVMSCVAATTRETDIRKAMQSCAPRFAVEYAQAKEASIPGAPTLAMGKWSGLATCGKDAKHHRGIIRNGVMVADAPRVALLKAPERNVIFRAYLKRFAAFVRTRKWTKWPAFIVDVGQPAVDALRKIAAHKRPVGFDVETLGVDPLASKITCVGISDGTHTVSMPWDSYDTLKWGYVKGLTEYGAIGEEIRSLILNIVTDREREIVTQNGNYDVLSFSSKGVKIINGFDTMHAHAIAYPELGVHRLEEIAAQLLNIPDRWKSGFYSTDEDLKGSDIYVERDQREVRIYNAGDCLVTFLLRDPLKRMLAERSNGEWLFRNAMHNAEIAMRMYRWGWKVDLLEKQRLRAVFSSYIETADRRLTALLGAIKEDLTEEDLARPLEYGATKKRRTWGDLFDQFSVSSDGCIRGILYCVLGEDPPFFTESGNPSVSAQALADLLVSENKVARVFAKLRLRSKRYRKLLESYIDNLGDSDVIRANVNVSRQISGRWSVTRPALQTANERIKTMFIARDNNWIVGADFSALEAYVIALAAGEIRLLELFQDPTRDVHKENGAALFGCKVSDITSGKDWRRQSAKTFLYGSLYGADNDDAMAQSLWEQLKKIKPDISYMAVRGAVERWWRIVPRIRAYQQDLIRTAYRTGSVIEPFNKRERKFFGLPPQVNKQEVKNFPCQAGGSAVADRAIQRIDAALDHSCEGILLQQHDGFYIEVPDPIRGAEVLRDSLIQTREINGHSLTFVCDYSVGKRWGKLKSAESIIEVSKIVERWK